MSKRSDTSRVDDSASCTSLSVDGQAVHRAGAACADAAAARARQPRCSRRWATPRGCGFSRRWPSRSCACAISRSCRRISQSGVSHQLRLLRELGLVTFRRDGNRAVYRLADEHVRSLLAQGFEHAAEERER